MSALDLEKALRNPGRLVLNPTTFGTTAYPYGGTKLGAVREVELAWGFAYHRVVSEDFNEVSEVWRTREVPVLAFTLEQWDEDLVKAAFPQVKATGSPSGIDGMLRIEGGKGPGRLAALDPLLFAALDPRHPSVLFQRPVALLEETARLRLSIQVDAVIPLVFVATRPSTHKSYYVDRLEHLALT